jgi:glutathione S-transferase
MPSVSPFCIKVETYLRMADLPYVTRGADPRKNPKGKIPWIDDDGTRVTDSSDIIDYLKATHGDPLDRDLTPQQRAEALLARRTIEEHLYWVLVYSRWAADEGFAQVRGVFGKFMPKFVGPFILDGIRRKLVKSLWAQGVGRHAPADIYRRGAEDLTALSVRLGDRPYLLGDQPTTVDASLYAFTVSLWLFPVDTPIKRHLGTLGNLVAYTERMHNRYFGEHPPGRSPPMPAA